MKSSINGPSNRYNIKSSIDVCNYQNGTAECPDHSECENNNGGYECICDDGWKKPKNGKNICKNVNECSDEDLFVHNCDQFATCTDNDGSFECVCGDQFNDDNDDGTVCTQIDECANGTHTCHELAACTNIDIVCEAAGCTTEGFTCECPSGYIGNGQDCADFDECATGENDCPENSSCNNFDGGFECSCNDGYKKTSQW